MTDIDLSINKKGYDKYLAKALESGKDYSITKDEEIMHFAYYEKHKWDANIETPTLPELSKPDFWMLEGDCSFCINQDLGEFGYVSLTTNISDLPEYLLQAIVRYAKTKKDAWESAFSGYE